MLVVLELELFSSSESDSTVLTDSFLAWRLFLDLDCVFDCDCLDWRGGESPLPESGDQEDLVSGDCSPLVSLLVMMTLLSLLIMITVVILIESTSPHHGFIIFSLAKSE